MNAHRLAPALALALALPAVSLAATSTSKGPRLAVILVVDQLSYETMREMRRHFGKAGIERLTSEAQAHYGHATTYTGPGHACIASGAYANKNGSSPTSTTTGRRARPSRCSPTWRTRCSSRSPAPRTTRRL